METVFIVLIVCLFSFACLTVVARSGREKNGSANFAEAQKMRKEVKRSQEIEKKQQETYQTMLHNIDVYDGTDAGQQDIV